MKTTKEKIAVMQAYVDGKKIECKHLVVGCHYFDTALSMPDWNWADYDYRVKEDKYRPFTPEEAVKHLGKSIIKMTLNYSLWEIKCIYSDRVMIEKLDTDCRGTYIHGTWVTYEELLSEYNFVSEDGGEKCGVKL